VQIARLLALAASLVLAASSASRAADAVATGSARTLSLGERWGPYESYRGTSFRWVENDAQIVLRGGGGEARVTIACEGGPSLGRRSFPIRVLDASRRQVDHVVCEGAERTAEMLLPVGGGDTRYVLHVDGGGKRIPGDRRILNFRVFTLDDGPSTAGVRDVVDPRSGVRLGAGWYPLEQYRGQTFRWMTNDAHVIVSSGGPAHVVLNVLVEVGPSVGSTETPVVIRDRTGRALLRTTLNGRGVLTVPLDLQRGDDELVVHVSSANRHVPGDQRILNLRLFGAARR
jgi:hypothetical protein